MPLFSALVLILLLILLILLVLLLVILIVILLIVLLVHHLILPMFVIPNRVDPAATQLVCAVIHDLSFALKIRLTNRPPTMAAVIPPAVALSPPVKIPRNPLSSTACRTPLARV